MAPNRLRAAGLLVTLVGLALAGVWWMRSVEAPESASPTVAAPAKYVDNGVCLGCHTEQAKQWEESHHALAMAPATSKTVRGDFGNRSVTFRGVTSRFFTKGDAFFVNTEGEDGKPADFEI